MSGRPQVVLLGMMTKIPVAGVVWQTMHYLVGLERLGYEAYYVEAHARTPSMLMEKPNDDSSAQASKFLSRTLGRFGFGDRWAFQALHADGRTYGMSEARLADLYRSAALIINLHGGTEPRPEHWATDRLVYLGTDPVDVEVQLSQGRQETVDYLKPHAAHFTFGENYGQPDCGLPVSPQFALRPTRQPVVLDFWQRFGGSATGRFTTIGNWRQKWRDLQMKGETYGWSKHEEFLKFIDLPTLLGSRFELALSAFEASDKTLLEEHGWRVREALPLSTDIDTYRDYITTSFGEFTVAKDQNVRLRTGWFSDRAATYLAAGRPVITQDTGFGNILPTGEGLFAYSTIDEIVEAVAAIDSDYKRHSAAAADIAREYFDATRVLGRLIEEVGLPRLPPSLVIAPMSRRPTTLRPESVRTIIQAPLPVRVPNPSEPQHPQVSAVVVTHNGHAFTRLCLETVLSSVGLAGLEVIVVDNASTDGTLDYLERLVGSDPRLRVLRNEGNAGFPSAVNRGLTAARGDILVVLNHDVVLPPRSLARLIRHLDDEHVGLVGPISNEAATEGEVDVSYRTLSELMSDAEVRSAALAGHHIDVPMLTMFCVAFRRQLLDRVGLLDERFEIGLFEDDDYSVRVTNTGRRVVCAEDVFVHHFGEAAFGALVRTGEAAALFNANRWRFEEKWGVPWQAHHRRPSEDYERLVERIRVVVDGAIPPEADVLVVSKGDEELLRLDGRQAKHFPQMEGAYAGHYPGDSLGAIEQLETLRAQGASFIVFPGTSLWWLDHYREFREHLDARYRRICSSEDCVIFDLAVASVP